MEKPEVCPCAEYKQTIKQNPNAFCQSLGIDRTLKYKVLSLTQLTCLYNCSESSSNKQVLLVYQELDAEGYKLCMDVGRDRHQLALDLCQLCT